jgi:hypothetical protein
MRPVRACILSELSLSDAGGWRLNEDMKIADIRIRPSLYRCARLIIGDKASERIFRST